MSWYYPSVHRGIVQFARDHAWHITADLDDPVPANWRGDGVVTHLGARRNLWQELSQLRVPIVDLTESRPEISVPRVTSDNVAIGTLAAEHFLDRGYRHFAMVHRWELGVSRIRKRVFFENVGPSARTTNVLCWQKQYGDKAHDRSFRHQILSQWVRQMPKPLGVFCSRDDEAAEVLEACTESSITVPEEIAVLGVDNTETICDCLSIPLSSIDSNMERVGYEGAALLDRLISGDPAPDEPIRIAPSGVIGRRSTDALAVDHTGVRKALRYVHDNFHLPIGVADLARTAGMSRSGLEKAFREHFVRSPGQELRRVRVDQAKRELRESKAPLSAVAGATGFRSSQQLCKTFRDQVGVTPNQYRLAVSAERATEVGARNTK